MNKHYVQYAIVRNRTVAAGRPIGLTRREGEAPVKIEATLPPSGEELVALAKRSK